MADLSDDELANGVYLFGDSHPPIAELLSGRAKTSGVWLDAAKNRIRWLSRKLDTFADGYLELTDENERLRREVADLRDFCKGVARNITDMLKEPKP
jgi:hypothetical protein